MSTSPSATTVAPDAQPVEFSLAEQWVIHSVMLDQLTGEESAEDRPWWALGIASKLESGVDLLSPFEAWRLRRDLQAYAADETTPPEDAAHAASIVETIDARFDPPPGAIDAD